MISIAALVAVIGSIALSGGSTKASSALASSITCMNANGVPATVVKTKSGKQVPIIYWKSTTFASSGWTPERRCKEVSMRFQQFHSTNNLEYITTGRMNGLPVICVANSDGGACAGLLYTLKPGQNATATLQKLFDVRTKPDGSPLEETTARMYVSVDSLIQRRMGSAITPAPMNAAPTTTPGYSLF
ncbi:COP23 domain-containing protein [Synechococcus sp. AH-603-L18]|nr:COP23 domain-containing protein [Synechococcus sp. AH-603-L18]MDB4338138.1 COP23 domain-containing protein [Synechococcus sp. AH-603-L18]